MNISARDRALLAAAAALAVLAAFYVLVLAPQRHRADQLQSSIAAAQKTLASAQTDYADGRAAQQRLGATNVQYAAAQRAVPGQSNIPALLRLLQRTADAADVSIETINLSGSGSSASSSSSSSSSASSASTTAGSAAATGQASTQTVPVSLTFTGGYQALNRMVTRLDTLVSVSHGHLRAAGPLVGISSVALTPGSTNSKLSVSLDATIYQHAAASSVTGATSEGSS